MLPPLSLPYPLRVCVCLHCAACRRRRADEWLSGRHGRRHFRADRLSPRRARPRSGGGAMSGHRTPAAGRTSLLRRLVPHPLLMLAIALGWLMLVNDFSLGSLLFGLLLGLVVAKITAAFWPQRARVRSEARRVGKGGGGTC